MSIADELSDLLGVLVVSSEAEDLDAHAYDRSAAALLAERDASRPYLPQCVVRPRSTDQVSTLLAWAHETRTHVVPYGGGSGVTGGIAPHGGIVVDMRAMRRIEEVDTKSRLVTAQAGVVGSALEEWLSTRRFTLGHAPQSIAISTVGGWVATKASGQLSAAYGGIEDLLVGLEAVLPGGRVVRAKIAPRRATGPDLAALLVGSEGTFGIVTAATLRVSPVAAERVDRSIQFADMAEAIAACRGLVQSDLTPTLVRLYDADDTALFFRKDPDPPQGPILLLSFSGRYAVERAEAAVEACGGIDAGAEPVAYWWAHRNEAVEEYERTMGGKGILGRHALVDTMEVSATWSELRDVYHAMKDALGPEADIAGCHISHLYSDGACLYFTLAAACASDEEARAKHEKWWHQGMNACLAAGGSISHHHGIGRLRAEWLPRELGDWYEVLRSVKAAIDPRGIMNPGVLGL